MGLAVDLWRGRWCVDLEAAWAMDAPWRGRRWSNEGRFGGKGVRSGVRLGRGVAWWGSEWGLKGMQLGVARRLSVEVRLHHCGGRSS